MIVCCVQNLNSLIINFFRAIICGPITENSCAIGSGCASLCSHMCATLIAGSVIPFDPQVFKSTHHEWNLVNPGELEFNIHNKIKLIVKTNNSFVSGSKLPMDFLREVMEDR